MFKPISSLIQIFAVISLFPKHSVNLFPSLKICLCYIHAKSISGQFNQSFTNNNLISKRFCTLNQKKKASDLQIVYVTFIHLAYFEN